VVAKLQLTTTESLVSVAFFYPCLSFFYED